MRANKRITDVELLGQAISVAEVAFSQHRPWQQQGASKGVRLPLRILVRFELVPWGPSQREAVGTQAATPHFCRV